VYASIVWVGLFLRSLYHKMGNLNPSVCTYLCMYASMCVLSMYVGASFMNEIPLCCYITAYEK
jgi:hypothetical protein